MVTTFFPAASYCLRSPFTSWILPTSASTSKTSGKTRWFPSGGMRWFMEVDAWVNKKMKDGTCCKIALIFCFCKQGSLRNKSNLKTAWKNYQNLWQISCFQHSQDFTLEIYKHFNYIYSEIAPPNEYNRKPMVGCNCRCEMQLRGEVMRIYFLKKLCFLH